MLRTLSSGISRLRFAIEKRGLVFLRLSVGIVFLWFGLVKFSDSSAAEAIAAQTVAWLTFGMIEKMPAVYFLAVFECVIGLSLLTKKFLKAVIPLMYLQMCGTILPLFVFPEKTWVTFGVPSLEGQYIIKNIVIVASGILLGAAAHGGKLILHRDIAQRAKQKQEKAEQAGDLK